MDRPEAVFKYVVGDRLDVLRNGRIRFTQAAALNDPFELKPFFAELVPEADLARGALEQLDIGPHLKEAYAKLPRHVRKQVSFAAYKRNAEGSLRSQEGQAIVAKSLETSLSVFRDLTPKFRDDIYTALGSRLGILSLSSFATSAPMWAHYAQDHHGLVFRFDGQHPYFDQRLSDNDEFRLLRPVAYSEPRQFASMGDLSGKEVFYTKNATWSYEDEWRMLLPLGGKEIVIPAENGDVHLFDLPPEAVSGVIVGAKASASLRNDVTALLASDARYRHVTLHAATLDARRGTIAIEDRHMNSREHR